jgi:1-acyl-sn-glycerol-3-phosphate acyltransferase
MNRKPWLDPEDFTGPDPRYVDAFDPLVALLKRYHRHEVRGLAVPDGPVLMVVHHSFATDDALLFGHHLLHHTSRPIGGLADNQLFAWPYLRKLAKRVGMVPANHDHGEALIEGGAVCMVAPGGMREALRPSTEKRTLLWHKRKGFVRLALRTGATIVPVACPAADDLYSVYDNPLTKVVYKRFRFPLPIVRGLGLSAIPRPVKLVHHVGAPIPVAKEPDASPDRVDALHTEVCSAVLDLLSRRT